jgi:malonate-semialdehyde dehydrogenase (acetylating)/methylmalonate-semialdehyde dehydrogenase
MMAVLEELTSENMYHGTIKNYINGEFVESETTEFIDAYNPATNEVIGKVPFSTVKEVNDAVASAKAAFPEWRETPPNSRAQYMYKLKNLFEDNFEILAKYIVQENGKTLDEARGSIRRLIDNLEVAAGIPSLMMGYNLEDGAAPEIDEEVVRQPLGVFAAVTPFNFPAMVPFWFLPYAVACGNTFVLKPSELGAITQTKVFELIAEAEFPPGVINMVHGAKTVVDAILDHPDVKGVSFVGSTPVGKYLYKRGAERGKRMQVQAGAKNCLVVMPDANLERSIPNMLHSFYGCAGQRCLAGAILVAVGDIHEEVIAKFVEGAAKIKVGSGFDETVQMGPVITRKSKARILNYIEEGIQAGAELVLDGRYVEVPGYPNGNFIGPTVFDKVKPTMSIARDEIFGPVVCIIPVPDLDAAIELIHNLPYGNAASIYTSSGRYAREFKYRVQCGNIGINVGVVAAMAYFPFGGYKDSFFGDLHGQGRDAINFFTERKVVITRWF